MLETKSAPFTFVKQGIYYFSRRVPSDISHHYTADRISYSLRTRSAVMASSRAQRAAQRLDEHWYHLRIRDVDLPGKHLLRLGATAATGTAGVDTDALLLSEAIGVYLKLKGRDRPVTFHRAAERACGYIIDTCGDKSITAYSKSDANAFRDALLGRRLVGSSITRIFGTVRSVINFAAAESGITMTNPFAGVYYDRAAGVTGRRPFPLTTIRELQDECRTLDDDLRWLVSLVSDTGLRIAEAAGLLLDDIKLGGSIPHLIIQEHPWRRLKTNGSQRLVPLAGASLWAARRIVAEADATKFAFPRYNQTDTTKANFASAALNKWMKTRIPENFSMHSFRHSMRDRLRAVECPADIVDQIGGWQTEGVGHSYGAGYPLEVLGKWMKAAV